jgi:hypothetical protein
MQRLRKVLLVIAAAGCSAPDDAEPAASTSFSALCAGARRANADGTATQQGCAFEQQLINIEKYGQPLDPRTLFDAEGNALATVTHSCGSWWLGTDADGTLVTLDGVEGAVRSHGMLHPGQVTSRLPEVVKTPLVRR